MISLSTALSFGLAALFLAYVPGPDILFVLAQSAVHGPRAGLATLAGLMTGVCFHTCLVCLGLAALIATHPAAFTLVKVAGALYLLYLAWLSWRASALQARGLRPAFPGYRALYLRGIVMSISNPKVSLFFLALLPQFCDPARGSIALQSLTLGIIFILVSIVAFSSIILLADKIFSRFNKTAKGQLLLHRGCALIFTSLALLLFLPV